MTQKIELDNLEIYKKIVEHMTESLWIGDSKNNTIYINDVFCDLLGYSQDELLGKNFYDFLDKKDLKNIQNNFLQKKIKFEANLKSKKGELIPTLCTGSVTKNKGIVLNISDLSELKSLKKAKNDLIKINKIKDNFISTVGHELRTPLTSIRGYLSMILEGDMGTINNEVKKSLSHTYNSSIRLIKLVNDILSIGKIESNKMEYTISEILITKLVDSVNSDIYLEIEKKGIKFIVDFDDSLKYSIISIDIDKLKQILLNLLTNALKFTKEGGIITFKISKIPYNKVRFEIIDTGVGIPKDKISLLFNKFTQVESSMQRQNTIGLGLGLAICKSFIKQFGSKIEIISEEKKGSTFYFDLKIK